MMFTFTRSVFHAGIMLFVGLFALLSPAMADTYTAPDNSQTELRWLNGRNIDHVWEIYRAEFDECDQHNTFGGRKLADRTCFQDANHNHNYDDGEVNDHNNVNYLFPVSRSAILFQSKLSLDLDGGYRPCIMKAKGTDQCVTSLDFNHTIRQQYERDRKACGLEANIPSDKLKKYFEELFVQSDTVPYIALPSSDIGEFSSLTQVKTGDVGVVIFNNRVVPVIVADRGPYFRLGEGSLQLFEQMNVHKCIQWTDTVPRFCKHASNNSIAGGVTTILFPGSSFARGTFNQNSIASMVKQRALDLYNAVKSQ